MSTLLNTNPKPQPAPLSTAGILTMAKNTGDQTLQAVCTGVTRGIVYLWQNEPGFDHTSICPLVSVDLVSTHKMSPEQVLAAWGTFAKELVSGVVALQNAINAVYPNTINFVAPRKITINADGTATVAATTPPSA
jgi:hypothetical protein